MNLMVLQFPWNLGGVFCDGVVKKASKTTAITSKLLTSCATVDLNY